VDKNELRQERAQCIKRARGILDGAAESGLTDAETRDFNALIARADDLAGKIGNMPTSDSLSFTELEENLSRSQGRQSHDEGAVYDERGAALRPGELRSLAHNDRLADVCQWALPDGLDRREVSVGRIVRAALRGSWEGAEAERRALVGSDSTLGGYLLPEPLSAMFLDLARARMVTSAAGARTIPVEADSLKVGKLATDPTVVWRGELEEITESDPTFEAIVLMPKVCAALVRISEELIQDGAGVGEAVENALQGALAVELDRAALFGSGAGSEPLGLFNVAGVNEVDMGAAAGAALTNYDPFIDAIQAVEDANGVVNAVIYAPRTKAELGKLKTGISGDQTTLKPPEEFSGLKRFATTSVPVDQTHGTASDASTALAGGFDNLWLGMRSQVRVDVSREAKDVFQRLGVLVRVFARMDVAVVRPTHLTKITGIIPP
jgi:HK97 family phage major capsid protein